MNTDPPNCQTQRARYISFLFVMAIFYHHNVCHYKISQYISNDKPNGNFLPFQVFAKIEKKIAFACCSNVTRLAGKSQKLAKLKLDTTADANLFLLLPHKSSLPSLKFCSCTLLFALVPRIS